jgi:hypothetical protein
MVVLSAVLIHASLFLAAISSQVPLRPKTPQVGFSPRFAVVPAQQRPSPSDDLAEAVVKKALTAYGGEAKILSFKNATFHYQVESLRFPCKPVQMKTYFKEASYFRSEAAGEGTDAVTILNRDKGW